MANMVHTSTHLTSLTCIRVPVAIVTDDDTTKHYAFSWAAEMKEKRIQKVSPGRSTLPKPNSQVQKADVSTKEKHDFDSLRMQWCCSKTMTR